MVNNPAYTWPASVTDNVTAINASLQTLASLINVCQSEGIRRQNYKIIVDFLPRLAEESKFIYHQAKDIRAVAPRRPGRPPKWVSVSEEIIALAITLIEATADIEQHVPRNYWSTIALLLSILGRTIGLIALQLDQVEIDQVPTVFQEALDDNE